MKVLISAIPVMLRGILTARLSHEANIEVIDGEEDAIPDAAVIGTRDANDLRTPILLLSRWPHSRIVMLRTDGRQAVVYSLHTMRLDEVSVAELVGAIEGQRS